MLVWIFPIRILKTYGWFNFIYLKFSSKAISFKAIIVSNGFFSTCTGTQSVYPYDFKGILQGKTLFSTLNRVTQLYYHKKTAFVASFYETCLFFGIISSLSGVPSLKVSLKAVKSFMDFNSGRLYQLFEEWEVCWIWM